MTPAIEVPWPPRYFVAEWMTTSAPHSQRADQVRRRDRVVDDERHARPRGPRRPRPAMSSTIGLGVGDRLGEERLGVRAHRGPPRLEVVLVLDERHVDAELLEGVLQQVDGAAVERRAGHDVVTGLGDVEQADRRRGLAGRHEQGREAPLERRDPLLHGILRRVHDPGVDVPELLEREQVRRVRGVVEDVGRRLVDRQRPGAGGAVGHLPGVDLRGLEAPLRGVGHRCLPGSGAPGRTARRTSYVACGATGSSPALAHGGCRTPGLHPGHPTAVGGLPASEPGLVADTHDLRRIYRRAGMPVTPPAARLTSRTPDPLRIRHPNAGNALAGRG